MDRLTFYDDSGSPCYRLKQYNNFYMKEISTVISDSDVARKLAAYENAEEQGLLKRPPHNGCKYCENVPSKYKDFCVVELFHQTAADDIYETDVKVNYCPNCGRKLIHQSAQDECDRLNREKKGTF